VGERRGGGGHAALEVGERVVLLFSSLLISSLGLSDTKVYEPQIRARLGTASHFCKAADLVGERRGGGGHAALEVGERVRRVVADPRVRVLCQLLQHLPTITIKLLHEQFLL